MARESRWPRHIENELSELREEISTWDVTRRAAVLQVLKRGGDKQIRTTALFLAEEMVARGRDLGEAVSDQQVVNMMQPFISIGAMLRNSDPDLKAEVIRVFEESLQD